MIGRLARLDESTGDDTTYSSGDTDRLEVLGDHGARLKY